MRGICLNIKLQSVEEEGFVDSIKLYPITDLFSTAPTFQEDIKIHTAY